MKLYNSHITKNIFSNLKKEDKTIITQINGKNISSHKLQNNILNIAKNLNDFWLKKDDKIVIFLKDNIVFSSIIISSILCGVQIILLDPTMWKKILLEKIISSKVTHIFIEWILYDYLWLTKSEILKMNITFLINGWSFFAWNKKKIKTLFQENHTEIDLIDADENSESITIFTWGTTGNPKWVLHSLSSIYEMLKKIKYFIVDTKVFYADMPPFLLLWLLTEAHIISWPYNIKPKKLKKILEQFQIDTYFCPPYKYNYFIENSIQVPKGLNNILLWSAPIYKWFLEKLVKVCNESQKITCIYGMTEILPISYIDGREKIKTNIYWDLLGYFIEDIKYKIIENELFVKWPHKLKNYLWYKLEEYVKTWDLVKIIDDKLVMIGRKKDMIIRKEYNVYPWVYEPIINQIPWVFASALIWFYDKNLNDEKIILYIEKDNSQKKVDKNYIYNALKYWEYSIDIYTLPNEIIFCKLPTIGRQKKIDKNSLRNTYLQKYNLWK
jgi:acyl-coenzyme A synthetase/AMP-(fatty) acid ligase